MKTLIVFGVVLVFAACGDRISYSTSTRTKVVENNTPIPHVVFADDTEISDSKKSSDRNADEKDTGFSKSAKKTTLDEVSSISNAEDTAGAGSDDSVNIPGTTARIFHLSKGRILRIDNKRASIIDKNDRVLCRNETLIRLQDEYSNCMSDGFRSIKNIKGGFVLEQQNCGGRFFMMETIEFMYSHRDDAVYITKFVLEYIDRFGEEHESKFFRLTAKDFGQIRFEEVDLEKLYELSWKKGKDRP